MFTEYKIVQSVYMVIRLPHGLWQKYIYEYISGLLNMTKQITLEYGRIWF